MVLSNSISPPCPRARPVVITRLVDLEPVSPSTLRMYVSRRRASFSHYNMCAVITEGHSFMPVFAVRYTRDVLIHCGMAWVYTLLHVTCSLPHVAL